MVGTCLTRVGDWLQSQHSNLVMEQINGCFIILMLSEKLIGMCFLSYLAHDKSHYFLKGFGE